MNKVDNPTNLNSEFSKVNPQAGKLRFRLLIFSILIAWFLLALIASLSNPLGTVQVSGMNGSQGQTNSLADSLLEEIIASFLSPYTLLYLFLFLFTILASYILIREIAAKALLLESPKPIGKFLERCAFNRPAFLKVDTQESGFEKTDSCKILKSLGGPAQLTIGENVFALVAQEDGETDVLVSDHTNPVTFIVQHGTKLQYLFSSRDRQMITRTHSRLKDGTSAEFHGVRITYSINHTNLIKDEKENILLRKEAAAFFRNHDWNTTIEDIIQCEFGAQVSKFSGAEILDALGLVADQPANNKDNSGQREEKTHGVRKHGRFYHSIFSHTFESNKSTVLRNRRRSIQPEMHAAEEAAEEEMTKEPEYNTIETLSQQMSKSINAMFCCKLVNIHIEEIGKVSFDGIH